MIGHLKVIKVLELAALLGLQKREDLLYISRGSCVTALSIAASIARMLPIGLQA